MRPSSSSIHRLAKAGRVAEFELGREPDKWFLSLLSLRPRQFTVPPTRHLEPFPLSWWVPAVVGMVLEFLPQARTIERQLFEVFEAVFIVVD